MLGAVVTRIAIRMALHRLLAEGGLDIAVGGGALDRKNFIEAALGHHSPPDDVQSFHIETPQVKNVHPRFASGGAILTFRSGMKRLAD